LPLAFGPSLFTRKRIALRQNRFFEHSSAASGTIVRLGTMQKRSHMERQIPKGIVPHLTVKGAAEAIEFYKKAFGAEELYRHPHTDGRIMHATLKIGEAFFYLNDDFPEFCGGKSSAPVAAGATPIALHQNVPDTDAAIKRAADAGATVVMPASDQFWGDRYGQVKDPFGHLWTFGTPLKNL
jgi:PhnB protein